jgi:hypothetical protein
MSETENTSGCSRTCGIKVLFWPRVTAWWSMQNEASLEHKPFHDTLNYSLTLSFRWWCNDMRFVIIVCWQVFHVYMNKRKITWKLFRQIVLSRKIIEGFVWYGNYAVKSRWRLSVAWEKKKHKRRVSVAGVAFDLILPSTRRQSDPQTSNIF